MKSGDFDPAQYAPVAERITHFYLAFPSGRIVTDLISRSDGEVVFRASVYRASVDASPAATGWASEREGDGDVNEVACLENTETSAVGRALANLGFTASRQRPSAEEMAKAARARTRLVSRTLALSEPAATPVPSLYLTDLLTLISAAERAGLRRARASVWRARLAASETDDASILRVERRLRTWIARQPGRRSGSLDGGPGPHGPSTLPPTTLQPTTLHPRSRMSGPGN